MKVYIRNRQRYIPLILGVAFGLLAGIAIATDLSMSVPDSAGGINIVGFHMALFLLSAAIGGPVAAAITPITCLTAAILFGAPDLRAVLLDPLSFWTNSFVMGAFMALIGVGYRTIFERMKMPARLMPWILIILAHYALHPAILEFTQTGRVNFMKSMTGTLDFYTLQILFDIFFTSLVFIALPALFAHPLWYEAKKAPASKRSWKLKKTIWQSVLFGIALGLLAGVSITVGLSFVISNALTTGVIGFHIVLFLLSASIGGPLAGFITPAICVIFITLFGAPEFIEFLSRPNTFWTNMFVPGMVMALAGIGYRLVFKKNKLRS